MSEAISLNKRHIRHDDNVTLKEIDHLALMGVKF